MILSEKARLRKDRTGTVINTTSILQEKAIIKARSLAVVHVENSSGLSIRVMPTVPLKDIVAKLKQMKGFDDVEFHHLYDKTFMKPDGGILYIADDKEQHFPIAIAEVKNQGTNDLRLLEGKARQAQGNAIERLGKNVIGFRAWLLEETIFPFIAFGYGCDFGVGSSILDRVTTIANFQRLNTFAVQNVGPDSRFQRGCFYFRLEEWSVEEMAEHLISVMEYSINYYRKKYPDTRFELSRKTAIHNEIK